MSKHNNWTIMGRLLADPEVRTVATGDIVLNGVVNIHEPSFNPKTNEWEDKQLKVYFEQWNEAAVRTSELVGVGDQIVVSGRLRPQQWVDKNGMPRTTLRIKADNVSLERKRTVREYTGDDAAVANPDEVYASI